MSKIPKWVVGSVQPLNDYKLRIVFKQTGEVKIFDMKPYLDLKIYAPLKQRDFFSRVSLCGPSIGWPGDIDIAPECLYENSAREEPVK